MHHLFSELGIKTNANWRGDKKVKCPKCQHERSAKNRNDRPLSINLENGKYNCHHCGWKGKVVEDKYDRPKKEYTDLSLAVQDWLADRQLSMDAAKLAKIGSLSHKGNEYVIFNYYDQNGVHVNAKMRNIKDKKDMRQSKNAKGTPFNAQFLRNAPYVIIVEGEPDCLAWSTSGNHFVITGPTGASDKWVDLVYDELDAIEKIYIGVDNDEKGQKYAKDLARRFDPEKLYKIDYGVYKDANEVLQENGMGAGKEILRSIFDSAEPWPVDGISRTDEFFNQSFEYFVSGYPETFGVGVDALDKHWSFHYPDVTVVTGTPNAGKSEFLDWLVTKLAKKYGFKAGIYSGEKEPQIHLTDLAYKVIGKSRDMLDPEVDKGVFVAAHEFLYDHFFYMNTEEDHPDQIIEKAKFLVKRYGIRQLVIDNFSTMNTTPPDNIPLRTYIGDVLRKFSKFSKDYQCHSFLVIHPRKMEKDVNGIYKMVDGYDLYESSMGFNLIDNLISIRRNQHWVDIKVGKIRHQKFVGQLGVFKLEYKALDGGQYYDMDYAPRPFDDEDYGGLLE